MVVDKKFDQMNKAKIMETTCSGCVTTFMCNVYVCVCGCVGVCGCASVCICVCACVCARVLGVYACESVWLLDHNKKGMYTNHSLILLI